MITTKERKTGQKVQYDILRCHRRKKNSKTHGVIQKDVGTTVKRIPVANFAPNNKTMADYNTLGG